MSVEVYSNCQVRIEQRGNIENIDKALVELRHYEILQFFLEIYDRTNRQKIFRVQLTDSRQYRFSDDEQGPDTVSSNNQTIWIFLPEESRGQFRRVLKNLLTEFLPACREEEPRGFSHDELKQVEEEAFYRNPEPFECVNCLETIDVGQGIWFRQCLHASCKECLVRIVETSTQSIVNCPHESCSANIGEREIRGVIRELNRDQKLFDRLLNNDLQSVEGQHKTFHCLTPDCVRWWFVNDEDKTQLVFCEVCRHWICFSCQQIHEGLTCEQFKEFNEKQKNLENVRKDEELLQEMINKKEIMYCPGCKILIQKISGCDWIQCLRCKLEICWPTQGPRWGPAGRGDTTGGCKCRLNGKLCVPNCGNCH